MKKITLSIWLLSIVLLAFSSCEKKKEEQTDNLEEVGILGNWKLESRSINGIASLAAECCTYLEFMPDANPNDLKGEFQSSSDFSETDGTFTLNTTSGNIQFDYNNKQVSYDFQISGDLMSFTYTENNNQINESWKREE